MAGSVISVPVRAAAPVSIAAVTSACPPAVPSLRSSRVDVGRVRPVSVVLLMEQGVGTAQRRHG